MHVKHLSVSCFFPSDRLLSKASSVRPSAFRIRQGNKAESAAATAELRHHGRSEYSNDTRAHHWAPLGERVLKPTDEVPLVCSNLLDHTKTQS